MNCPICTEPVDTRDHNSVRLSNTSPPWRLTRASALGAYSALGGGFAEVLRAVRGEPEVTYWFHRHCWGRFTEILDYPAAGDTGATVHQIHERR